jgi:hypothetical protein
LETVSAANGCAIPDGDRFSSARWAVEGITERKKCNRFRFKFRAVATHSRLLAVIPASSEVVPAEYSASALRLLQSHALGKLGLAHRFLHSKTHLRIMTPGYEEIKSPTSTAVSCPHRLIQFLQSLMATQRVYVFDLVGSTFYTIKFNISWSSFFSSE